MSIKHLISRDLSNIIGFSSNRKFIVFESDDWGSVRIPNLEAVSKLRHKGIINENSDEGRYLLNDTIETYQDFEYLFEILLNYKDLNENHPKFTALSILANPDFGKIKECDFERYYFEPFTTSYNRYGDSRKTIAALKSGIESNLYCPQFHGREHLNVHAWLRALKQSNEDTLFAFDLGVYGIKPRDFDTSIRFQAAFDIKSPEELFYLQDVIESGLSLFKLKFGFEAKFFVPTNGPFNNSLEPFLAKNGVSFIGASKIQYEPLGYNKFRKRIHFLGQKNKNGQYYLTRNCFFEPSSKVKTNWIDSCMAEISSAFRWNKPAIISTHRVNYMGSNFTTNRSNGLKQLEALIKSILKKWPDAEFIDTVSLGNFIKTRKES